MNNLPPKIKETIPFILPSKRISRNKFNQGGERFVHRNKVWPKEIKAISKWKDTPGSRTARTDTVKMATPQSRLNAIPLEFQRLFAERKKLTLKLIRTYEWSQVAKTILKKKKVGRLTLLKRTSKRSAKL